MPVENELSKQNIVDRYHGRNDPVAKKIMSTHAANMGLQPPEDLNIVRTHAAFCGHPPSSSPSDFPLLDVTLRQLNRREHPNACPQIITRGPAVTAEVDRPCHENKVCHHNNKTYQTATNSFLDSLRCAFVNWRDRATAELAAQAWANGLEIDGETINVRWGRSKGAAGAKASKAGPSAIPVPSS